MAAKKKQIVPVQRPKKIIRFSRAQLKEWQDSSIAVQVAKQTLDAIAERLTVITAQRDAQVMTLDAISTARTRFLQQFGIGPEQRFVIEEDGVLRFTTAKDLDEAARASSEPEVPAEPKPAKKVASS